MENDLDLFKMRLRSKFYSYKIEDPYPELTQWELVAKTEVRLSRVFGIKTIPHVPKPEISAHKAWMDGFNFAKSLIEDELK